MPRIDTVVTDLDDTVFDWAAVWCGAVRAMMGALADAGVRDLRARLQSVHRRHQSLECPSAIGELAAEAPGAATGHLARAAAIYRREWQRRVTLHRTVAPALAWLRRRGVRVIAWSESPAIAAAARLHMTGLADAFAAVVCTREAAASPARLRLLPLDHDVRPQVRGVRVDRSLVKGHAASLAALLAEHGADPARTLVIGDHAQKDLAPALDIGATSVWARYGTRRRVRDVALIDAVCHWPRTRATTTDFRVDRRVITADAFDRMLQCAEFTSTTR